MRKLSRDYMHKNSVLRGTEIIVVKFLKSREVADQVAKALKPSIEKNCSITVENDRRYGGLFSVTVNLPLSQHARPSDKQLQESYEAEEKRLRDKIEAAAKKCLKKEYFLETYQVVSPSKR